MQANTKHFVSGQSRGKLTPNITHLVIIDKVHTKQIAIANKLLEKTKHLAIGDESLHKTLDN